MYVKITLGSALKQESSVVLNQISFNKIDRSVYMEMCKSENTRYSEDDSSL